MTTLYIRCHWLSGSLLVGLGVGYPILQHLKKIPENISISEIKLHPGYKLFSIFNSVTSVKWKYLLRILAQRDVYVLYSLEKFGLIPLIFMSQHTYCEFPHNCCSDKVTFCNAFKSFAPQLMQPQQAASGWEERKITNRTSL